MPIERASGDDSQRELRDELQAGAAECVRLLRRHVFHSGDYDLATLPGDLSLVDFCVSRQSARFGETL